MITITQVSNGTKMTHVERGRKIKVMALALLLNRSILAGKSLSFSELQCPLKMRHLNWIKMVKTVESFILQGLGGKEPSLSHHFLRNKSSVWSRYYSLEPNEAEKGGGQDIHKTVEPQGVTLFLTTGCTLQGGPLGQKTTLSKFWAKNNSRWRLEIRLSQQGSLTTV